MPVKTWDTKADFDGAYEIGVRVNGRRTGEVAHYERRALYGSIADEYDGHLESPRRPSRAAG